MTVQIPSPDFFQILNQEVLHPNMHKRTTTRFNLGCIRTIFRKAESTLMLLKSRFDFCWFPTRL